MSFELSKLMAELPVELPAEPSSREAVRQLADALSQRPIPVGRLTRLRSVCSAQAKIALAYAAYWLRYGYAARGEKERRLNETHLSAALELFSTMSYLRGAFMKVGQLLANYPNVLPAQFIDTLNMLHFEAPPMHFSLLREFVRNELGADPADIFDEFETKAFAAASLGQVHRARLKTGEQVAVKVQYPNIGRTIREDMRNLSAILAPMRFTADWENLRQQLEDICRTLERETDYLEEAARLQKARTLFVEADRIVVPRVFAELSTARVLTTEYLDGVHIGQFLASHPTPALRNSYGERILRISYRMLYAGRRVYADPHPGNYLFLKDGRLGLIDFGCCREFTPEEWDYFCQVHDSPRSAEHLREALRRGMELLGGPSPRPGQLKFAEDFCRWVWEPGTFDGDFDFGDEEYLRRGVSLYAEGARRGYVRSKPVNTWLVRDFFGVRALAFRLGARFNAKVVFEEETSSFRRNPV